MSKLSKILFYADSLFANLRVYLFAHILFRVVGMGRMVLWTWLLLESKFGSFNVGLVFTNLAASMVLLGAPSALERYIPFYQNAHQLKAFLRRILPLCFAIAVLAVVVLALNVDALSSLVFSLKSFGSLGAETKLQFSQLAAACVATVFAAACFHMVISCLKGLRYFRAVAALELTYSLLFTALAVVLLLGYSCEPVVVFVSQALSMAVVSGVVGLLLLVNLRNTPDQDEALGSREYLSRFGTFAAWGLPGTITWRLLFIFPLWYLNRTQGPEVAGTYSAYFRLTNAVFFLSVPFWSVMNIHAVRHWVQAKYALARSTVEVGFKACSLFLLLLCMVFTLAGPVLSKLFPSGFSAGAEQVRFICMPVILAVNFGLVHLLAHLLERPGLRVLSLSVGAGVLLLVGYFVIPVYGMTGAALSAALGLGVAIVLGLVMLASRRCYVSLSTWMVLACPLLLLISNYHILIAAFIALIVLALVSPLFFLAEDKRRLYKYCMETFSRYWPKGSRA